MIDHSKIKDAIDNYFNNTPTTKIIENLDRHAIDRKKYLEQENIARTPVNNKESIADKLVRFEEVSPANRDAAFIATSIESLVVPLALPIYQSYDDLDEMQLTFLTLPSGETVTLMEYIHSPQPGVCICVDAEMQNIPQIVFDSCLHLQVSREEVIWFHPDWQGEIDRLYAEYCSIWQSQHYANEKHPESSHVEELTQNNQYEPIDCFNHALRIYTREDFPTYWAMLQHNLGLAYQNRSQGSRKDNLESSVECFYKSLEIYKQDEFPEKWKINQEDLRESYRYLKLLPQSIKNSNNQLSAERIIHNAQSRANRIRANLIQANLIIFSAQSKFASILSNLLFVDQSSTTSSKIDVDLRKADLSDASLIGINLRNADLSGANLRNADLSGANLRGANLLNADLSGANLRGANLVRAKLSNAKVTNTQFSYSNGISPPLKQDLMHRGAIFDDFRADESEHTNLVHG